jgi:hypothetical protein
MGPSFAAKWSHIRAESVDLEQLAHVSYWVWFFSHGTIGVCIQKPC